MQDLFYIAKLFEKYIKGWYILKRIHKQSFGSQSWDAAFAMQAIIATNLHHEFSDTLKKGHDFIKQSQVLLLTQLSTQLFFYLFI